MTEETDNKELTTLETESQNEERQEVNDNGEQSKEENQQSEVEPRQEPVAKEEVKKPRSQQRIEQLLEKNKQIEQEKKELEERLKVYEKLEKPDAEKYEDDDEYEIDKTAYIQQKASYKQDKQKLDELERKSKQELQKAYQLSSQDFYQKIDKATDETKNFIRQNAGRHRPRNPEIEMEIMDSEYGAEIFEIILKDADKFNSLSDSRFIKEVAKIEAKFENANKPIKPPISIPAPPTDLNKSGSGVNANASNTPDWAKMTYAQLKRMG